MKDCTDCTHAAWKKTDAGRLHPSGDGRCTYEVTLPVIPASKWWSGGWTGGSPPRLTAGEINRRQELRKDCPCYQKKETK